MNKLKLFIENFLVYGLGGIISKIIPLIMVPIITRIMPDSFYYGISDLSNTVVQFASAIAIMGMYDAMYRMFFEKDDEKYKKSVCSTALMFTVIMSVIIFIILLICRNLIAELFFKDKNYAYVVYLSATATLVGATNSIISAPTRMENKRKVFLLTNAISPIISYSAAIPMLLAGHYVIALPLAAIISGVTMEVIFGILNRKWFAPKLFDQKLLKQLLVIAVPLLPNFLIYWLFNSCDKLMIANILNVGEEGIYSVGAKLGHASQLIYTAFAGGWQYFAFSTMKEENQVKSNSMIFEYLGIISFAATAFICALSYMLYKLLFPEEYHRGYIIAPYLFLAPLLQMLFQVAGNQFLVVKNTWPNMFILLSGAVLNILLNLILIPEIGIEGAAIATLMGYAVSDIVCMVVLCKMKLMVISKKFLFASAAMILYMILWRILFCDKVIIGTAAAFVLLCLFALIYRDDIKRLFYSIKYGGTK